MRILLAGMDRQNGLPPSRFITTTMATPAGMPYRAASIIAFDWDGTAVPSRDTFRPQLVEMCRGLIDHGVHLIVVTGTSAIYIEQGLLAHLPANHRMKITLCTNRGSEVSQMFHDGTLHTIEQFQATPEQTKCLDLISEELRKRLENHGVRSTVITNRLNRHKIDLLPDLDHSATSSLSANQRVALFHHLMQSRGTDIRINRIIHMAKMVVQEIAREYRLSTDGRYLEVGLTDKSDSARWIAGWLWSNGIAPRDLIVAGDEFGPIGGLTGSDARMLIPELGEACFVSVGRTAGAFLSPVINLGGGPDGFHRLLDHQLRHHQHRRRAGFNPLPLYPPPQPRQTAR